MKESAHVTANLHSDYLIGLVILAFIADALYFT